MRLQSQKILIRVVSRGCSLGLLLTRARVIRKSLGIDLDNETRTPSSDSS